MNSHNSRVLAWLESIAGGPIDQGNQWQVLAEFEKSPPMFSYMLLQFLDEFESCFGMNVEHWVDSLYLLYERCPQLRDLMRVSDCFYGVWLLAKDHKIFEGFDGELLSHLFFALRKFAGACEIGDGESLFAVRIISDEYDGDPGTMVLQISSKLRDEAERLCKTNDATTPKQTHRTERGTNVLESELTRHERVVSPELIFPKWNNDERVLWYGDKVVRRYSPSIRSNVRHILNSFEECGWPSRIDDPLPSTDAEKTKQALRTINKGLTGLLFSKDGDGIKWAIA